MKENERHGARDRANASGGVQTLDGPRDEISLLAILNVLLRHRRVAFGMPIVLVIIVVVLSLLLASDGYKATARFTLQTSQNETSRLASLAAQFGAVVDLDSEGESPAFYMALVESRELLRGAVETRYRFPAGPDARDTLEGTLVDLYEVEAGTDDARVRQAMAELADNLTVESDLASGLISLEITAPWPDLAVQITQRLIELVNEFNSSRRQSQAKSERIFVEARMATARQELDSAVAELRDFLERNRRFESSPYLMLEKSKLEHEVAHRQQVYTALATSYEQVRIAEVRDMPAITIVEPAAGSARPAGTNLLLNAVIAFFFGSVVGACWVFLKVHFERQRLVDPDEYAEFNALVRATVRDLGADRLVRMVQNGTARERKSKVAAGATSMDSEDPGI